MSPPSAVILYDGVCNLCNAWVTFVLRWDRRQVFRFAPLQSEVAQELLVEYRRRMRPMAPLNAAPDEGPGAALGDAWHSVVLIEDGRLYRRSTAALRILRRLSFPWPLFAVLLIVPRPLRDFVYAIIAANRYRWFGRRDTCVIPSPEQRARFLE